MENEKPKFSLDKGWKVTNLSLSKAENGIVLNASIEAGAPKKTESSWKSQQYVFDKEDMAGLTTMIQEILGKM